MSKLYASYSDLKKKEPDFVYLFKVGIFYIALEDDAIKLSECLNWIFLLKLQTILTV